MNLLLDTHAFLWWLQDNRNLGRESRAAIVDPDNRVFVSAATAWEIAVKRSSGRLEAPGDVGEWIETNGFDALPIEVAHAVASAELPKHHADPFDRLLIAQAVLEGFVLMARDDEIDKYDVEILDAHS